MLNFPAFAYGAIALFCNRHPGCPYQASFRSAPAHAPSSKKLPGSTTNRAATAVKKRKPTTRSRSDFFAIDRDRRGPYSPSPPTPPGMRVRTGRFEKLRLALCSLFEGAGVGLHRCLGQTRLHLVLARPLRQCGHLMPFPTHRLHKNHSFSFSPSSTLASKLLRLRLTSRSGSHRHPFRHKARSPQVRTHSFTARPPDLRRRPLVTRASRSVARSPWSAPPSIRFLFIGPQLRSTLPPHTRSPSCSCASLRSL